MKQAVTAFVIMAALLGVSACGGDSNGNSSDTVSSSNAATLPNKSNGSDPRPEDDKILYYDALGEVNVTVKQHRDITRQMAREQNVTPESLPKWCADLLDGTRLVHHVFPEGNEQLYLQICNDVLDE